MTTAITRNLLLKEDINFDTAGTNEAVSRVNPAGGTANGTKFNASHLPTPAALRAFMSGTTNVSDTLQWLYENFTNVGGDATTEKKGIIEIATLAEARAGTDTVKAITPYLLKNTKASTTQYGTLLLASEAEALAGTDAEKAVTPATMQAKIAVAVTAPVGSIIAMPSESVPAGYLECDGSSLLRTSYSSLLSAIGTRYGAADSTHFNIPDYRGFFLRGWAHGSAVDSDRNSRLDSGDGTTGDHVGTGQDDAFESHTHDFDGGGGLDGVLNQASGNANERTYTTSFTGGDETRPKNINVMYCIKY